MAVVSRNERKKRRCDALARLTSGMGVSQVTESLFRDYKITRRSANLKAQMVEGQRQIQEQKLREMTARNEARDKAIRDKKPGFTPDRNIGFNDPSAIKARREWGLSDDIGLGA